MKIGIAGGGWYGCHLGLILKRRGFEVEVHEAGADVLQLASANNQSRLHAGYHYPRCSVTRLQTVACFPRFMKAYPTFTRPIENNVYAVSKENSLLDFRTYCQIMKASGLFFEEVDPTAFGVTGVGGAIAVEERVMDFDASRRYFREHLGSSLFLNSRVESIVDRENGGALMNGKSYDLVINCTWCALETGHVKDRLFFEPTILLYYEALEPFYGALTVMDGPCFSVYPYDEGRYTLSHVACTARGHYRTFAEAKAANDRMTVEDVDAIRRAMEDEVRKEFPSFSDRFRYLSPQFSLKTKYENRCASRDTSIKRAGSVITVFSGKIDTVFVAEDLILAELGMKLDWGMEPEEESWPRVLAG